MFGTAFGQVVGGAVSDIKGRKPVALTGLIVYCLAVAAIVFASSTEQLLNLRAVQAFGAGMAVVIVGAMVRDYYSGRKAAQMFALIGIILMVVPLVAPMVGALLQGLGGWRAIFVFLAAYSPVLPGLVQYFLPNPAVGGKIGRDVFGLVAGRFKRVLKTRAAMGYLFFQAFSFGSMFAFLTESSFVYRQLYHVTPHRYAWVFALNIITMMFFSRVTAWRLKTGAHPQSILLRGIVVQFAANPSQLAAVLFFGLPPFWLPVACVMFSVGTQGLVGADTQACFMSYFKEEGGSANAVSGVFRSLIGAGVGMAATVMAATMTASASCGIALLWLCSHKAWKENEKKRILVNRCRPKPLQTAFDVRMHGKLPFRRNYVPNYRRTPHPAPQRHRHHRCRNSAPAQRTRATCPRHRRAERHGRGVPPRTRGCRVAPHSGFEQRPAARRIGSTPVSGSDERVPRRRTSADHRLSGAAGHVYPTGGNQAFRTRRAYNGVSDHRRLLQTG
ncbi:multidrug effflux MFS transporter [Neisseria gonorrhoeae]|nr:multidrug effflux MFS transporter [Neisseria gonorrhoeae]